MITVLDALREGERRLADAPDSRLDAEYLLCSVLQMKRLDMLIDKKRRLTGEQEAEYERLLARRESREPLQYILGSQSFMGFSFRTDPRALIPRFDTEALCQEALSHIHPGNRILDLCTGSGCLAVAIKKLCPGAEVTASDISGEALSLAMENAAALQADVRFLQGDLFSPARGNTFHVIVSNPPYIPDALRGQLQREVEREPALALFGGKDGLDFYRRIAKEAPEFLEPRGYLCLETGDGEAEAVSQMLKEDFRDIRVICDLNGLPRVVSARRKEGSAL